MVQVPREAGWRCCCCKFASNLRTFFPLVDAGCPRYWIRIDVIIAITEPREDRPVQHEAIREDRMAAVAQNSMPPRTESRASLGSSKRNWRKICCPSTVSPAHVAPVRPHRMECLSRVCSSLTAASGRIYCVFVTALFALLAVQGLCFAFLGGA